MKCPHCGKTDTKVLDSRPIEEDTAIRRRRECEKCNFRFSTYEEVEILGLTVLKRNGTNQAYSRLKLEKAIQNPFDKRDLSAEGFRRLINKIEQDIQRKARDSMISSIDIGEITLKHIKKIDKVAYIRFACVYRGFEDIEEFKQALEKL